MRRRLHPSWDKWDGLMEWNGIGKRGAGAALARRLGVGEIEQGLWRLIGFQKHESNFVYDHDGTLYHGQAGAAYVIPCSRATWSPHPSTTQTRGAAGRSTAIPPPNPKSPVS